MEKHILNLLNHNLRVIIPDFGAFIIRQKEPVIIVFNEFLKYNDGLLIDYIAKTEQIEKDIARQKVADYAESIIKTLNSGKEFKISGVGILRKTDNEKIEFVQAGTEPAKRIARKQPEKTEEKPSEVVHTIELTEEKALNAEKSTENNIAEKTKQENIQAEPTEQTVSGKTQPQDNSAKKHAEKPVSQPSKKIIEKPVQKATIAHAQYKPAAKKKNHQQLIWVILILLVVALINGWFIFNKDIRNYFRSWKAAGNSVDTIGQMIATDTSSPMPLTENNDFTEEVEAKSFIKEPEVSEKIPITPTSKESIAAVKKYYIVAGCFRDENNANAMVRELIKKGYKAEKFGTIGNLHAVSYNSYTSKDEAIRELARIRKEVEPEAWLVYY